MEIAHQSQGTVLATTPAKLFRVRELDPHVDAGGFSGKTDQLPTAVGNMTEITEARAQQLRVTQHRWQDGEVGHSRMPALHELSDCHLAVQWPISKEATEGPPVAASLRLAVMASGNGSNFEAVARACIENRLAGQVLLLVVNNAGCGATTRAERLGIPWKLLDHRRFESREALDEALIECFESLAVDVVVMAGWMRIVTPTLIRAFPDRIVNIHPSLLPSFRGMDAVGQALAAGVTLAGCTAHLVSEEVDAGRILVQAAVPVFTHDDPISLSQRIHSQEHRILPLAVQLAANRLRLPHAPGDPSAESQG